MACIYSRSKKHQSKEPIETFCILTCKSTKALHWLHDRMPVVLEDTVVEKWLDYSLEYSEVQKYCVPYEGDMECYPVDPAMSNPTFDNVDVIKRWSCKSIRDYFLHTEQQNSPEKLNSKRKTWTHKDEFQVILLVLSFF
ncbi:abasic site processing protein HMCES-like [Zophobas morio]|uniref:abasic site processing protein HMCES-like n=1 Tax=Zophobas morio TaxID=2755281 RepID=UPI003083AAB8